MKNNSISKVILVTGCSSGIGLELCKIFIEKGHTVFGIARSDFSLAGMQFYKCDIKNEIECELIIKQIVKKAGKIDVLINNAGMGISGSVEATKQEDAKNLFDVNFFGTFHCIKAVLPFMREKKSGKIVNISSAAGIFPLPFQTFYSASKAAVISFSRALRTEVKPFNIKVSAVLPGDIKTGFTSARKKNKTEINDYKERSERSIKKVEKWENNGKKPETIAKVIAAISLSNRNKPVYNADFIWRVLHFISHFAPLRLVDYIISKLYG